MPRVPTVDNYSVMPNVQPAGAFSLGISPEQATVGARQIEQAGQQLSKAGEGAAAVQIDATLQASQLRIDGGLNDLKESAINLRFDPQIGFENAKGIDALQRPSGQSLTQEYGTMLEKRASDIENTLTETQKVAFRQNANNIIVGFKGEAERHEGSQFQTYALSVREGTIRNRMTEIGLNYNNIEITDQAVNSIKAAAYDQARLLGKSAEWAEAQSRDATSKAHTLAIQTALQKNNPSYADGYLKKYAKDMQPDDILQVNGSLTKQLDGQIGLDTATQVIQEMGPKITTSDSDRAFNIALGTESNYRQFDANGKPLTSSAGAIGIAQVMPATAPEAAKLAGLPWDEGKYKNDADYNRALGKAYFDQQLKQNNGNLAMAYAAYNAGPGRLEEGMKAAKDKGTPQNWLQEMPTETQNYVNKNMTAFGVGAGQFDKPTLVEVQNSVREKIGPNQPERLRIALDESERQYKAIETATKQRSEEAVAAGMRGVMENGGRFTDLPANVRGAIAPEDTVKVMDFAKRIANGDDTTSLWLYNKLTSNPEQLKNMTDDQFFALRSELSQADFKHFADERGKMITGRTPDGPGDLNSDAITRTLNDRLNSMGIDPTPKDGSTNAERVGAVRRFVNQSIAVEQANRGKKMNDVEVSGFIDSLFAQKNKVISSSLFGGARLSTVNDIPSATRDALKASFKRNGVDNPTDADLLNAYWRQVGKIEKANAKANTNG